MASPIGNAGSTGLAFQEDRPRREVSSLRLMAFARYVHLHETLPEEGLKAFGDVYYEIAGKWPEEGETEIAVKNMARRVRDAVHVLLSEGQPISSLTPQDIDKNHVRALYKVLHRQGYIADGSLSDIHEQRAAIARVDAESVTELCFYDQRLRCIPEEITGFPNLQKLNFLSNQISEIPDGIFDKLVRLEELSFQSNQISVLPPGIFDKLLNLRFLELSSNQISKLPAKIFDKMVALILIDLSGNPFKSRPRFRVFKKLKHLSILYLSKHFSGRPYVSFFTRRHVLEWRRIYGRHLSLATQLERIVQVFRYIRNY